LLIATMKLDPFRQPTGGLGSTLLPAIVAAIILRTGAFGRRPHPKVLRIRATTERVFQPTINA